MTDEVKKDEDVQAEAKVEAKADKKDSAKKADKKAVVDNKPKIEGLEELPDDIVKKLEKNKANRAKDKGKRKKKKAKAVTSVKFGNAYIKATYNNTIVTLTDSEGNVISWASAGVAGFKGAKKSTPYAAQIISRIAIGKAREMGLEEVNVFVSGVGTGRESAVRALNANGLNVLSIKDITPIPHNGCRAKKPRRV